MSDLELFEKETGYKRFYSKLFNDYDFKDKKGTLKTGEWYYEEFSNWLIKQFADIKKEKEYIKDLLRTLHSTKGYNIYLEMGLREKVLKAIKWK